MTAETLYRWVKASERLPEVVGHYACKRRYSDSDQNDYTEMLVEEDSVCIESVWYDKDHKGLGYFYWLEENKVSATLPEEVVKDWENKIVEAADTFSAAINKEAPVERQGNS